MADWNDDDEDDEPSFEMEVALIRHAQALEELTDTVTDLVDIVADMSEIIADIFTEEEEEEEEPDAEN